MAQPFPTSSSAQRPTLRQLEAFIHIYRLGSLTQAAQAMHVTQSAMSVLLRQLEDVLEVRLFDRTARNLRPTPQAQPVYELAQQVLHGVGRLVSEARDAAAQRSGVVRLAASSAVAASLLPDVLVAFGKQHPGVRVEVLDIGPDQLLEPVLDEQVEFSIGTPDVRSPALEFTPLLRDALAAICRDDAPLVRQGSVRWSQLADEAIITVRPGNGIRTLVDGAVLAAGIRLQPRWEVGYLSTALAMTARGLGVSVLPAFLVAGFPYTNLAIRPLVEPTVARDVLLITRRQHSLSPAAEALLRLCRQLAEARRAP